MTTDLRTSLQSHFGFDDFRPGQIEAIQNLLNNQHTLVVMPTGSGKSLIYQLVALELPGLTLVISPLIALMKDQVDSLERREIPATFINSSLSTSEQNRRLQTIASGGNRLVYVSPERLRSVPFLEALHLQKVNLLAIDEAHCISEWGHDFRPDYLHIAACRNAFGNPLTVALTATATRQVQDDIIRLLNLPGSTKRIITGFNRPNLLLQVCYTLDLPAKMKNINELLRHRDGGATIIYTGTRRDAEEIAEFVKRVVGIPVEYYHAGLNAEERNRIQEAFIHQNLEVVAATNAFGMGIDRADVRRVIHYSLPGSLEAYYQEVGRAGRDGLPSQAVVLYAPQDRALQEWFIENSAATREELQAIYQVLRSSRQEQIWISTEDLSRLSGIPEVKIKVGLADLEAAGAVEHLGDEGLFMQLRLCRWDNQAIEASIAKGQRHQSHKRAQLRRMVEYAETNTCRRRMLLDYFGDRGPADAQQCCDNCQGTQPASQIKGGEAQPGDIDHMAQPSRIAWIVLEAVKGMRTRVGREKLRQILKGSRANDILHYHYDRNPNYGKLNKLPGLTIDDLIEQLIQLGFCKVIGGKYPVISLTAQGEAALRQKTAIPIHLKGLRPEKMIFSRLAGVQAGNQSTPGDPVADFLSHSHPHPVPGPWQHGWALDFHSRFTGSDWSRSLVGELAYRFKYQGDLTVLPALVEPAVQMRNEHPELFKVDAILAVPPSSMRSKDPVSTFCAALGKRLGIKNLDLLMKTRQTSPQKEIQVMAQKRANVAGAFALKGPVKGLRLLVVDDLFDSGATLEEITHLLLSAEAAQVNVLTLTRTIHSDA